VHYQQLAERADSDAATAAASGAASSSPARSGTAKRTAGSSGAAGGGAADGADAADAEKRKRQKMSADIGKLNTCVICLEASVMPVTLTCGHQGCGPCFLKLRETDGGKRLCPICRKEHSGTWPPPVNTQIRQTLQAALADDAGYMQRDSEAAQAMAAENARLQRAADAATLLEVGLRAQTKADRAVSRRKLTQQLRSQGLSRDGGRNDRLQRMAKRGLGGIPGVGAPCRCFATLHERGWLLA
jgi:hypothetical protein